MSFPPGRPIILLLLFAMIGSVGLLWHRADQVDQVVWVFDPSHADTYQLASGEQPSLLQLYQQQTGRKVQVQLMAARALDARLLSLILSDARGKNVPDLVEIEIGSVGKYFRASPDHNGLLPLDELVQKDPLAQQLLPARLATWSSGGHLFGIPHDVHPVSITYRQDLFAAAGVNLAACQTWAEFHEALLRYQQYWQQQGQTRRGMQLARWNSSDLMIMLYQQGVQLIDSQQHLHLDDPRVAKTMAFYATLVAGRDSISADISSVGNYFVRDLAEGNSAALFTPDWRIAQIRANAQTLDGKLRMMPLPRFATDDAPTASWGGTMIAIPRNCPDPSASWQLLRSLQLTPQASKARLSHTLILPANRAAWLDKEYDKPDPLFGGQPIGRLYTDLARQLPSQEVSPYGVLVSQALSSVLSSTEKQLKTTGPEGLEDFCRQQLLLAQKQLAHVLQFANGASDETKPTAGGQEQ